MDLFCVVSLKISLWGARVDGIRFSGSHGVVAPGKADRLNSWAKHAHSPRIYAKVSTFPHPTDEVGEQADRFNQLFLLTYCLDQGFVAVTS